MKPINSYECWLFRFIFKSLIFGILVVSLYYKEWIEEKLII